MDFEELQLFLEVARRGSFAAVARDRNADPSAVSRAIAGLEARLGLRLFQRSTRQMQLTEAGSLYRMRIEPLLDELAAAADIARASQKGVTGTLRLSSSVAFGVRQIAPLLPLLAERYPALRFECQFTDAVLDLVEQRIDLAIRLGPGAQADYVQTRLADTRYHVVASHAWAEAHPVQDPAGLCHRNCLCMDLPGFRDRWQFRDPYGQVSNVAVSGAFLISAPLAILGLAQAGAGPALLPDWLVGEDIRTGALVDLFPDHVAAAGSFDSAVWAIYPSRSYLPAKVRVVIDFLRERLAKK